MTDNFDSMQRALRRMPAPQVRPGFVDKALARATARHTAAAPAPGRLRHLLMSWEAWIGVAVGGAVATALTLVLLHSSPLRQSQAIALSLHEVRSVDVIIDSERALKGATISIAASGSIILDGFDDEHEVGWRADLDRGTNLLSLPVQATATGRGKLVAIIEHGGRTREVAVDLTVVNPSVSRS